MLALVPRRPPGQTTASLRAALGERDFKVDIRTIQRDLNNLSSHFPLVCDEGRPARWYWAPHSQTLSLPSHDPLSAMTWQLIEQYLKPVLPRILSQEVEPQFRAAREYLRKADANRYRRWASRVRILPRSMQLQPPSIRPGVIDAVYQALFDKRQLQVRYRSRTQGKTRSWTIHPLALVVRDSIHYLLVRVWEYADIRQIVMHRILDAELLDDAVEEPKDFDLEDYVRQGGFDYSRGREIRLVARFDSFAGQAVIETPLSSDQSHREIDDGRIEIEARVTDSEQLRWWLMGFGSGVEVISPKRLREYMRKDVEVLATRYERP